MISYSDFEWKDPKTTDEEGFKPFQGWFPILTVVIIEALKQAIAKFQTLPEMISYSDIIYYAHALETYGFQTLPGMISYSDTLDK